MPPTKSLSVSRWTIAALASLVIALSASSALVAGQNPTLQGHPDDYVRADIEYGARLFVEQCAACHGENGDGVAGVDLKSGKFKNAVTDPQLRTVITNGFPATGMPAFAFTPSELTGIIELIRRVHAEGVTLIVIEHIMAAMMRLAQRIVMLHHGEKLAEGAPAEITRDRRVIDAYLGEEFNLAEA